MQAEEIGQTIPAIIGKGATAKLTGTVAGVKAEIACGTTTVKTQPESSGKSGQGSFVLNSCQVVKPAGCSTSSSKVASFIDQLEMTSATKYADKVIGSGASEKLMEIEFTGASCAVKGTKLSVNGSQGCELEAPATSKGPEVLTLKHVATCSTAKSSLQFGANPANLEAVLTLEDRDNINWAVTLEAT